MKTIYNIILIILILFSLLGLISCEKTVVIDSRVESEAVVIEGLITNQPDNQYVKITKTVGFYDDGETPRITNAIVTVTDDLGNEFPFYHNPNGDDKKTGFYFPASSFVGEIGHTYKLSVTIGAELYEGEDELYSVSSIDSLGYRINENEKEDPKITGKYYELLAYMKEPQDTKDYYLFKFYRNDSVTYYLRNSDIYFTDDTGIGENIAGFPSPVYYALNDKARMEIYSLSRNAYLYYSDLSNLINSDGGMLSPPPTNPRGNMSNNALGFFRTSAINSATTIVEQ